MLSKLPAATAPGDQAPARIFVLLGFVDGEQLESGFAFDFRWRARNQLEGNAIEIERQLVSRNTFLICSGIRLDQSSVPFEPGEICFPNKDAAHLSLVPDKTEQAKLWPFLPLREQNRARIEAKKVLAVPFAMIVALAGDCFLVP